MAQNILVNQLAQSIRLQSLRMVHRANASHIGSCLSMADLLAVLYGQILRVDPTNPNWLDRDRFILSKGHSAAILYAVIVRLFSTQYWLNGDFFP